MSLHCGIIDLVRVVMANSVLPSSFGWCPDVRSQRPHCRLKMTLGLWELQREVNQRLLGPIHASQIKPRADRADFIPNPVRDQRGF